MIDVAFLGLGEMGGPMCGHVVRGGFRVAVYDPDPVRVAPQVKAGARAAASPADAAAEAQIVCIVVRTDDQARTVVSGPGGVLSTLPAGSLIALHSTVAPTTVRAIHDECTRHGARFIDAAISGAATGAVTGSLYVMCGGAEKDIDEAAAVIGCFASHIRRFGDIGTGMAAKLARNLAHYAVTAALDEAMILAEQSGVELPLFADLIRNSRLWPAVEVRLDRTTTAPVPPDDPSYEARKAYASLARKDLNDAFVLAAERGVDTPIARATYGIIHTTMQIDEA
jgi:3-hydroxyisobutyrate dehydrogenase-like beta-hydroxyacid dehydrogenase